MGLLLSRSHLHGENNSPQSVFDTDWLCYSAFQQNYKHSNLPIFIETLLGKNCDKCHCIEMATQDCWNGGEQHGWADPATAPKKSPNTLIKCRQGHYGFLLKNAKQQVLKIQTEDIYTAPLSLKEGLIIESFPKCKFFLSPANYHNWCFS